MAIARASIIAGPAQVTFNGQTLFSKEDIKVSTKVQTFDVKTAGRPSMKREDNVQVEITFTPNGVWAPVIALINPYASMVIGTDIFGSADVPLVIHSVDGFTYTYSAAALTKLPDIYLSGGKTLFGAMTFTALGADNTAPSAANRRVTIASAVAYPSPDGYDPSQIMTQGYSVSWGSGSQWSGLDTEDGSVISFRLSLKPKQIDSAGIIGMRFTDMEVTAKAKPVGGIGAADVLTALNIQGTGAGRGRALANSGQPLAISGSGIYAQLYAAALIETGDTFGGETNRIGTITWMSNTQLVSSVLKPLFYLGTAAPGS
jgi:hypothetical protein